MEQFSRFGRDHVPRRRKRESGAVGPVGRDGIPRVGHRKNPGAYRNLVAAQPARIAASIPTFVVRQNKFGGLREEGNAFYQFISDNRVTLHHAAFLIVECPWFEKNTVRRSELSDVMQPRTHDYDFQLIFQSSKRSCELYRIPKHAPSV